MKNSRKQAILILSTLHSINKKYKKLYCYPAQLTIMALLSVYQDTNISIATLNRWLRDLENKGYINRIRRIKKSKDNGTEFKSTLYKITLLGYQSLKRTGVNVWKEVKAMTTEGLKIADRALSKHSGPIKLKTVLAATGLFKLGRNVYIVED